MGVGLGVVLRIWMRLISDDPEFSWGGTLAIVTVFTLLGTNAGLVAYGRARGWRAGLVVARVVACVLGLGCFMAAGAVMLPTIIPGALALGRRDWNRWVRRVLAGGCVVGTMVIALVAVPVPFLQRLLAMPLFVAASVVEVRLFAELLAPSVVRLPRVVRWTAWAAPALVLVLVAVTAVGV